MNEENARVLKAIVDGNAARMTYIGDPALMIANIGGRIEDACEIDGFIYVFNSANGWARWNFADHSGFIKYELPPISDKELFEDGLLQKLLDNQFLADTQVMLRLLADHFTANTRYMPVQKGTMTCRFYAMRPYLSSGYEIIQVPLYSFFGMMVGYNVEFDILVFWVLSNEKIVATIGPTPWYSS